MGYIRHNAIVVTSWNDGRIDVAAEEAARIGLQVIGPSDAVVNNYRSILVCPDGSKEGWTESIEGDTRRSAFRRWLDTYRYDGGSSCLEWVEISYGSDDRTATIEHHGWTTRTVEGTQEGV